MKYIRTSILALAMCASTGSAQTGQRIIGANQFQLDDSNPAHSKLYLTNNVGSLGIDQSGLVTGGIFPSPCALLDLSSTTQGFLPPRMTTAQELAICGGTPTEGLIVYNTTTHTLDLWNGASFVQSWSTKGNGGTTPGVNFIGTTDAQPLVLRTNNTEAARLLSNGNLAIGAPTATSRLQITESGAQGALASITSGSGRAGYFEINNGGSFSPVLEATSNSSLGSAAVFRLTNGGFAQTAVQVFANSPGSSAIAIQAYGGGGSGWFLPGYPCGVYGTSGIGSGIEGSSASGIGTYGGASTGTGVYAQVRGTGNALLVEGDNQGVSTTTTNNLAVFMTNPSVGVANVARIDNTGKGYFNGGTQAFGADIAEAFQVEGNRSDYEPGDVLVISQSSDRTVTKCTTVNSSSVAGVYATKPGVLLSNRNINESQADLVPMGVVGVIPTKVCSANGPIHRGDLLVTSAIAGHAMKAKAVTVNGVTFYPNGIIIGKALENFTHGSTGIIEVMVNVK